MHPRRCFRLDLSLGVVAVRVLALAALLGCGAIEAGEDEMAGRSGLRIYTTRAANPGAVAPLLAALVPADRIVLIPGSPQIAVFANADTQEMIARRISEFEKQALLRERIDLSASDSASVEFALQGDSIRHAGTTTHDQPLRFRFDRASESVVLLGTESQLERARRIVRQHPAQKPIRKEGLNVAEEKAISNRAQDRFPQASPAEQVEEKKSHAPSREPRFIPVPLRPVRIVHVKELDLFLIRGSN